MTAVLDIPRGIRSRYYDPAATAALTYEAEALTPLDAAASGALSGASGGRAVTHSNLGTNWTPVLSTDLAGSAPLTHAGSYRVRTRVYTTSATPPELRFLYDVGDFTLPEELDVYTIPGSRNFYWADLGVARLDKAPAGTHRWKGVIQARGAVGGENVSIDIVDFVPVAEGGGLLSAPINPDIGLNGYIARDEFNQAAGSLAGKTAPVGGAWVGAGDATDLTVDATGHTAQRTVHADTDVVLTGRYAISGAAALAAQVVQIDASQSVIGVAYSGVVARYTNVSNWLKAQINFPVSSDTGANVIVTKRVGGTATTLLDTTAQRLKPEASAAWTLRLSVDASGIWLLYIYPAGSPPILRYVGYDSDLATGGPLATGKPGFYDSADGSTACTRNYDNFAAWVPTSDAVIFGLQSAELRTDGMVRLDATGSAYGPISEVEGVLPRVPPSGVEGRTVEFFVRPSRGDFDQLADSIPADGLSVQVYYRPSFLFP